MLIREKGADPDPQHWDGGDVEITEVGTYTDITTFVANWEEEILLPLSLLI